MPEKKRNFNFEQAENITGGLRELGRGSSAVAPDIQLLLDAELRRLASAWMRKERKGHTLCTTALVNEVYLRILGRKGKHWNNRQHFLADASRVMRRVLVDYSRRRQARIQDSRQVPLEFCSIGVDAVTMEALEIDQALETMAMIAPRQAQLVELRFFGGCSLEEAAETLGISARTADKDWLLARAWLKNFLDSGGGSRTAPA
jgi:RNA polymerase sigma factor (TIGR02999 family)